MHGKIPAARLELIEKIAAQARSAERRAPVDAAEFVQAYYRGVSEEDLAAHSYDNLAGAALRHLESATTRKPGESIAEVFNPDPDREGFTSLHTVILVTTDDAPFLVDSMGIVLNQCQLAVHFLAHPILTVRRDARGRLRGLAEDTGDGANNVAGNGASNLAGTGAINESWQLFEVDRETDPERLATLRERIINMLDDVRHATRDWKAMRNKASGVAQGIEDNTPDDVGKPEIAEARELLQWMEDNHFTFLGYREYRLKRGRTNDVLEPVLESGLGILSPDRKHARETKPTVLTGEIRDYAREKDLLILTKANAISTVHRATYLDYVSVKTFNAHGDVSGEHRFLGLWTSTAYSKSPHEIPVLRHKVQRVVSHFGLAPASHDAKAVMHVLETYPRDELFQANVPDLIRIVRGIVNLYERQQVRLFVRRDAFRRFYSCMVYIPRDRYTTQVRLRIEGIAREEFQATAIESQVQLSDSVLARLMMLVRTNPADAHRADIPRVEQRFAAAVRTWGDGLKAALLATHDEAEALRLNSRYAQHFPPAYQADSTPQDAVADLVHLEALQSGQGALRMSLGRDPQQGASKLHFRLFRRDTPIPISDVLPMMENLGLKVISERPYEIRLASRDTLWIQDFELENRSGNAVDLEAFGAKLQDAFAAVWQGQAENDGFNRLVLAAGLAWREAMVLRAYSRYLVQTGLPFSQAYMEQVLSANAGISALLSRQFATLFDPALPAAQRNTTLEEVREKLADALDAVTSLDEDRILRAFAAAIGATLRTNHYQKDVSGDFKSYLSLKFDPEKVKDLPLPRPMFEVFVYSTRVEGVHLRKGKVARGGLRWSDRREDFRTEVLGLMKAQNVKNTVIVPVGAKGGFVPKRLPAGSREEVQREVVSCYQTFIRGLLDLADNISGAEVVPPADTVRRDPDDSYFVVAADKGTATFSDIANKISNEYGFWLGDAFASGGSAGYDHKKMAITSRGAWECVKRHFREIGIDTQTTDFTVSGIGDMSGDVFGNGMLRSPHARLLAAFDHRHIFLDPDPDAAASFGERQRLFNLPRSSWEDYDATLISRGGGVHSRQSKAISLTDETRKLLGIDAAGAAPNEVIRAILRMPVDLFWNGGIGTYVKSSRETHADIGDRANDAVRVNGNELRARVAGEGGNLGFSQLGRVEYALAGGRLNTDFIDNSGGVNCSDVEVNIKILLNGLVQSGKLKRAERDRLLAEMTDEVAELVLRNNYLQGQAISTLEAHAAERFNEHLHVIRVLQQSGDLDPALEFLPRDEEVADRRKQGRGLTRPELAIVLAYSKIWLNSKLIHSNVPEDPYLSKELERYFPSPVVKRFRQYLPKHRLRREIIVTATANSLVNRMGPVFALRAQEDTGAAPADIARAYTIAREVFGMRELWTSIEGLDNKVAAATQYAMMYQTSRLLRHMTYWFLQNYATELEIEKAVSRFAPDVELLVDNLHKVLAGNDLRRYRETVAASVGTGVPEKIAERVAGLLPMNSALDIVEVAQQQNVPVELTAATYFLLGERLGLDWVRDQVEGLASEGHWQAVARSTLRDNLYSLQRGLTAKALAGGKAKEAEGAVDGWLAARRQQIEYLQQTFREMKNAKADFPTLSVALQAVRRLAEAR